MTLFLGEEVFKPPQPFPLYLAHFRPINIQNSISLLFTLLGLDLVRFLGDLRRD
jgi:hypothetical protein